MRHTVKPGNLPKQLYWFEDVADILTASVQVGKLLVLIRHDEKLMEVYVLSTRNHVANRIPDDAVRVYTSATPEYWLYDGPWTVHFEDLIQAIKRRTLTAAASAEKMRRIRIDEVLDGYGADGATNEEDGKEQDNHG